MFIKTRRMFKMYFFHFNEMKKFLVAVIAMVFFISLFAMIISLKMSNTPVTGISSSEVLVKSEHSYGTSGKSIGQSLIYFGHGVPMLGLLLISSYFFTTKLFILDSKKGTLSFWISTGISRWRIFLVRYLVLQTFVILIFLLPFTFNMIISHDVEDKDNFKYVVYSGLELILTTLVLNSVLIFGAIISKDNSLAFAIMFGIMIFWVVAVGNIDLIMRNTSNNENSTGDDFINPVNKYNKYYSPFGIMPPYFVNPGAIDSRYSHIIVDNMEVAFKEVKKISKFDFVYAYLIVSPVLFGISFIGSLIFWSKRNFDSF